ncbi:putative membrane protein [Anaerosolibacter carboniphilus]|uniref:Putative membrane protein n=1 Tax=Anaerosolibacter carboniphilus TaxID=1417629 RepID=A0A841L0M6_9FIRM|nr:DUF502 domain-containing protein [Anaerosolibacter carboniphilus]MBB6217750.1 putative membrane protein [Anaerosolibacter carboniphilus]
MKHVRGIFFTGLLALIPIVGTLSIVGWLFNRIDLIFRQPLEQLIGFPLVGVGIILTLLIIFATGVISRNYLGRKLIHIAEAVLRRIPLVSTVFVSMKQLVDLIFTDQKSAFKSAVLVQYPTKGIYAIGFVTSEAPQEAKTKTDKNLKSIFIPTTPNPTSGMLVMIPDEDTIKLDITVEAAIKMVVSGGILIPDHLPVENKPDETR